MGKKQFLLFAIVMGLISLGFGIYIVVFEAQGFKTTTAVIDHVDETWTGTDADGISEYTYDVYVDYTVDGKQYHGRSDFYADGYEAGKEIKIYYNPENPEEIHGDAKGFGIYLIILGPVLIAAAGLMSLRGGA